MLRDNIVNDGKMAIATFKATAEYKTGMGVVESATAGKVVIPAAETATDIYLLDKSRIPTGINASRTQFSDYDTDFVTVKAGELCLLKKYGAGESFLTDQIDATTIIAANKDKRVSVGTDGKWVVAATTVASVYVLKDIVTDNGHTLAKIQVSDTAAKNA